MRVYAASLELYPEAFRERYGAEMLDTASREYAAAKRPLRFAVVLMGDTAMSVFRENLRATPVRPVMLAGFVMFFSFLLLGVALFGQQRLRRGADQAPEALTAQVAAQPDSAAARLGWPRHEISSPEWLSSSSSFLALYDASGKVWAANAEFEGALPQPPKGIFATIRARGMYKVTWQPEHGVRVALAGRSLPDGGFVLAGQSLIPGEARTDSFYRFLLELWAVMLLYTGVLVLSRWWQASRRTV
ncbi:hypothetical protein SAMN05421819_3741 [Bryocella elongata]|uniref:Uncharacterized protein n=2 Tax=Bryocella elongata TaxID=863522 RepID=A0A1H6BIP3_9BACT|nr:hypothetical protein SAMN05421819_3741 [Bryocella elongata]